MCKFADVRDNYEFVQQAVAQISRKTRVNTACSVDSSLSQTKQVTLTWQ